MTTRHAPSGHGLRDALPDRARSRPRSPVREKLLATAMLIGLGVEEPQARAIDFIAVRNGLLSDRLVGNGGRGAPADAAAILTAWLTGLGARQ